MMTEDHEIPPVPYDDHEREVMEEIERRDHWEDQATELARLVGSYFGEDFGEHSSANCPVSNAIEFLEGYEA